MIRRTLPFFAGRAALVLIVLTCVVPTRTATGPGNFTADAPSAMRPIAEPVPAIGGHYKAWAALAITAWAGALLPILYFTAKRRPAAIPRPPAPEPSAAERLRSSLLNLSQRPVTVLDKIVIEHLVHSAWRQHLRRPDAPLGRLLSEINDAAGGRRTIAVMQRWLYSPTPPDAGDVVTTLADDPAIGGPA